MKVSSQSIIPDPLPAENEPQYPMNWRLDAWTSGENFPVPTTNQTQDRPALIS
jgi:hypothetical protein